MVPYAVMKKQDIIIAVEAFAGNKGISPATVTSRAVGNSRLYARMKQGGDCTTEVAARLLAYIDKAKIVECDNHSPASARSGAA
ncbi:hypothetical protein SAMN04488032_1277 [Pacificibacter marinus]|uniref:Uncharacterized protein n=2 Tax=Pacificibacter marinus TaxID=658057 RepID=A0A1Y5TU60_9RHOB|nr:hypothetical protein SAMN04488032_1277 [Pacificibacter marinus]SLN71745.1 hypothetical protein PAM7971_03841 [Pacificibacter marinus]